MNRLRACPDRDGSCGQYQGKRSDGSLFNGVDVSCGAGDDVFSPFDGEMYFWRPFGGLKEAECADQGVRIEGIGQWQGHYALISSIQLDFYGGQVKKGDKLGTAISSNCVEGSGGVEDHVRVQLFRQGKVLDPSRHMGDKCMCTGQICETNPTNQLVHSGFKTDSRFNGVRGFDIRCGMADEDDHEDDDDGPRAPLIYSPIAGRQIGRIRLNHNGGRYIGCDNDGIFIVGRDLWEDYEVRIYNAKLRSDLDLGSKAAIIQGQPIGLRLDCNGAPDSVFVEVRYQGRVVDISDLILARNCLAPLHLS